ncbi:hypothetical protein KAS14_05700 [Candidatus Bathyarchaeota archaeon]|nr:hypothetical protein [Candidatus Bathyarchaeota archaeon]
MGYNYSEEEIMKNVKIALGILLKHDSSLLKNDVNERSISHKLAEYLQRQFPDWNVDCEYNRKGIEIKLLNKIQECEKHKASDRVNPDIIVHQRGIPNNLLVIELKKKDLNSECDIKKLELFTSDEEYAYSLGLFLHFNNSRPELKWFKDGKEIYHERFKDLQFSYEEVL